jgi:hypothetical protein
MSTERDTTRIVRSWLRTDEHESADRVLGNVLAALDATPQHRSMRPVRRIADMNLFAKLATAAAIALVAVVVVVNLQPSGMPGPGTITSPTLTPSPSVPASPPGSPNVWDSLPPEPTPQIGAFPAKGVLTVGRHPFSQNGVKFSLEVSGPGWSSSGVMVAPDGGTLTKADLTPQKVWMLIWSIDGTYADPCSAVTAPPVSPSAADLAAAVAAIRGFDVVVDPEDVTVGGRPAKHVQVRLRDDIGCAPAEFQMWYDAVRCAGSAPCSRWANAPGHQINDIWIVEVDGTHIWIEAETFDTATPATIAEVRQLIDSLEFE